jgi:DNA-binding MarR family transcriptional regulator
MSDYSLPGKFDRIIHQPSRLSIMAVLFGCEGADFVYLQDATGLTKGTLSKHLKKLEEVGYISIDKTFKGSYPNTSAALTPSGRKAFRKYRRQYRSFTQFIDTQNS